MINPNKVYKNASICTVVEYRPGLELIAVVDSDGQRFEGYADYLSNITKANYFKVGDKVRIGVQYSIVGERWVIRTMSKVRK